MLHENFTKLVLVLGALSLSACFHDGGGDNDPDPDPPRSGSYLFYSGSISAVDPATPASPITVEAGMDIVADSETSVLTGTYDAATKTLNNVHTHAIVYAKTNGKLYKVSALKSSGTPTPMQLSSETAADKICEWDGIAYDFANPDNSQMSYRTPGTDTICNNSDDVFKMVRLGMSAADTPVTVKEPIAYLNDWATGVLSGWLVNDAGALKRCDASFANCGPSLKSIASYSELVEVSSFNSNRLLLEIDSALYVYDGDATNTLSAAIHTIGGTDEHLSYSNSDGAKFYFTTSNEPNSIYVAPADGSAAATLLVTDAAEIQNIEVTANKLLYTTATAIKAMAKTDGTAATLATGTSTGIFQVSGNHIYYTLYNGAVLTAGVIDDDGSNKTETANASWVGSSFATSWNGADIDNFIKTIIRAEGYEALGAGKGFAGAMLRSFTAASKAEMGVLGTVPNDIISIDCSGFFANGLCLGSDASDQTDVLFLNSETPNSLVRVTNTPTKSEALIRY